MKTTIYWLHYLNELLVASHADVHDSRAGLPQQDHPHSHLCVALPHFDFDFYSNWRQEMGSDPDMGVKIEFE